MITIRKFGNGLWVPVRLLRMNGRGHLSGIRYDILQVTPGNVEIFFEGNTLISVNIKKDHYPLAHFFHRDMRDEASLYVDAHNTFLKTGMLPSEMWRTISEVSRIIVP